MGQSSEEYIELAEEWVNMNPITGFIVKSQHDLYFGNPDWQVGHIKTAEVIKKTVKKKT